MKMSALLFVLCALLWGGAGAWAGEEAQIVGVTPHKALYKVSLVKAKPNSGLQAVSGSMIFDMADACDGWTVHQYMQMTFAYDQGEQDDVMSSIVTWEAKDGKSMVFHVKRMTSAKEDEGYKGRATITDKEGTAHYTYPQDKEDTVFPAGTVFPITHTAMIVQKAREGEKLFTRRVFDGSDAEGSADVSVFNGARNDKLATEGMLPALRDHTLISEKAAWPVRLAFYPPVAQAAEPDYEMELVLQENGIARSMVIDYGDFSIAGTLTKIEEADTVSCSGAK